MYGFEIINTLLLIIGNLNKKSVWNVLFSKTINT